MTPHFPAAAALLEHARVKNTFLDFRDEADKEEGRSLKRFNSDPILYQRKWIAANGSAVPQPSRRETVTFTADIVGVVEVLASAKLDPRIAAVPSGEKALECLKFQLHLDGRCKPCRYFNLRPEGCINGMACSFCHFCDASAALQDKRKAKHLCRKQRRMAKSTKGPV
ncbi:hypothetical protein AK812_SmicGene322 [Symbiodinium microadriaticum]|uniref:C3H1-type domain-containing protein n=1 Tax=Symbiodinium microadriaticum TaxID=2951 RepID=A0A1Q9F729_SYMMI|nr:hypothetical protein AK812_SmicGene322 [Symbiodinium microadriaticum]